MPKLKAPIPNGDRSLATTVYTPDEQDGRGVLLVHGFGSNRSTTSRFAKLLQADGVTCLAMDLGGHGQSDGELEELSVQDHVSDVEAAYDHLAQQPYVFPEHIGGFGISYGGYLAVLASNERSFSSLLLRSAPLYPDHLRHLKRGDYSDEDALSAELKPDNRALQQLQHYTGTVAVVESANDTLIRPGTADMYADAAQTVSRHVIPEAGHVLDDRARAIFNPMVLNWARQL